MNPEYARFIRLISLAAILCSSFASGVHAAPIEDPPPSSFVKPSLEVLPAWAWSALSPPSPETLSTPTISTASLQTQGSARRPAGGLGLAPLVVGDTIEVFTNTWSYSTIGLVYDPGRDHVRYAHESQSSSHNPTIYDVAYPLSHTLLFSVALSTKNSGWPWQIDNCTGAGYDFVEDTYFLPDYNGDLSYADDNIVEIDADGVILNAWEMDDEVGSNDSSDGSEIDSIIDIAVVPGTPTRYFATAAYDGSTVYEISLQKTGAWWTPNSWRTVTTYTIPVLTDNLGIDYDAENERLYHSGWHTTTILVTDLNMNPVADVSATFDCPGAGGYNSGVTFIEGSTPPELWVTDFSSDKTTRCEAPGGEAPPAPGWSKWIDGQPWEPDLRVTKQLSDVVTVTDVITATEAFTLTEGWDPERLKLIDWNVNPPIGGMNLGMGIVELFFPAGPPEVVTITKWFHVEPCTWITTTVEEVLAIGDITFPVRPFTVTKIAPELWITSTCETEVAAGSVASFTLIYSNTGGYENNVSIANTFPITAPFIYAEPFPALVGPDGLWTRWDVGDLAYDARGEIDVYALISETVPPSTTIEIWDGIFDHMDVLQDETWITYHVTETLPTITWEKLINREPWRPGISVTLETSQTFLVEESIDPLGNPSGFSLIEEWNPEELVLLDGWVVEPITYNNYVITTAGLWVLEVPPAPIADYGPLTITKEFHAEPCTWTEMILWESLGTLSGEFRTRPVLVNKRPPDLWIDSFFDVSVYSREEVTFTLTYSNTGGLESFAWIENRFPPEAPFVRSVPWPTERLGGEWAKWGLGELGSGGRDTITITVAIADGLPPSTTIEIWDGIYNHAGELVDETVIAYHVPPPEWEKWVNGRAWEWDMGLGETIETSDTITVTDVISTRSAIAMVEHWDPERLALVDYITEPEGGIILSDTGFLSWEFPDGAPGAVTITKWFHVEPCTWTYTVLWEELWVEGVEWERRPVHVDKFPPDLRLESMGGGEVYAGQPVTFTLVYSNAGGYENDAWITNTFPIVAPFALASLTPTRVAGDGTWAAWRLGGLETGEEGDIDVTVAITESLVASTTIEIWDGIFHDGNILITDTVIPCHVAQPPHTWTKWIDGVPWSENISFTVETSDTVEVVDVISTVGHFELIERWNPDELALIDWAFDPPLPDSEWFTGTGSFVWRVPPAGPTRPQVVTLTKWFHVEPCTWITTMLEEELVVQHQPVDVRPVRFEKLAPELALTSEGGGDVYAGGQGRFTLVYSNTGGRENDVVITNTFPVSAPLAWAVPDPDAVDPDGLWARWDLGDVDRDARGTIEVTAYISETLEPSTTVEIWDGIYDHVGELISETWTTFHVTSTPPITWHKWISDVGWVPEFWLPVETTDVFTVTDALSASQAFALYEEWNAAHIALLGAGVEPPESGTVISDDGWLTWMVTPTVSGLFTLTKIFYVEPCTWTKTWLWENLVVEDIPLESRPVGIEKWAPDLWLESEGGGDVYAGEQAVFTLIYSNTGGYENDVWIWNEFPPEALFVSSDPPATISATNGITAAWAVGDLQNGDRGAIDVTVAISDALTPCNWITVTDWIYNHAGEPVDGTDIKFHVACKELASVTLTYTNTGAIYTDTVVHFEADLAPDDATKPYTYTIDYGDGVFNTATSDADPLALDHTFDATGTFTVEIAAWNCDMVELVTDVVDVEVLALGACIDVRVDALQSDSPVTLGEPMHFTATVSGDPSITYTWDFGGAGTQGGTDVHPTFVYDSAGVYTVTLDVENDCPSTDSDSIKVTVTPVCVEVTGVSLVYTNTGTIYTDTVVHFSADIVPEDADKPYTYTIDYGSGHGTPASSSDDPLTFDNTFVTTGTHTVEVAVWNCEMTSPVTDAVSFTVREQGVCVGLDSITIGGATSGTPGIYTFTTSYEPLDASIPITYAWDNGDTTVTSIRPLSVGTTTLTVTATNICTTVPVTDTHEIVVSSVGYDIYLPLVMRSS